MYRTAVHSLCHTGSLFLGGYIIASLCRMPDRVTHSDSFLALLPQVSADGDVTLDAEGAEFIFGLLGVMMSAQLAGVDQLARDGGEVDLNAIPNPNTQVCKFSVE